MDIGILGTGDVGRTLATALLAAGHTVTLGARSADNERARTWADAHPGGRTGTFADAAAADVLFLCVAGIHAASALAQAGDALAGKVLVDVSNPLDFSRGFPPTLTHVNDVSLAETLQAAHPEVRLVKALNTVANPIMVNPGLLAEATDLPICGNDAEAKQIVTSLLAESFGWQRIVDLGDVTMARGTEAWLLLWTRLFGALGTPMFNLRIVREQA